MENLAENTHILQVQSLLFDTKIKIPTINSNLPFNHFHAVCFLIMITSSLFASTYIFPNPIRRKKVFFFLTHSGKKKYLKIKFQTFI